MKTFAIQAVLATTLCAFAFNTHAAGISIAPIGNAHSADIVRQGNLLHITGSCGGAIVKLRGVQQESFASNQGTFSFDFSNGTGIFVQGAGNRELRIPHSDYNAVICLPLGKYVGTQFRLVIGTVCAGSVCGDAMSYTVYDPHQRKVVSPKTCDIDCASRLIKSDVLKQSGLM